MGVIISVPFLFFFIQGLFANALAGNAPLGHLLFLPQYFCSASSSLSPFACFSRYDPLDSSTV